MPQLQIFLTKNEAQIIAEALDHELMAVPTDDLDALASDTDLTDSSSNRIAEMRRESVENLINLFREIGRVIDLRNELAFRERVIGELNPPEGYQGPVLATRQDDRH